MKAGWKAAAALAAALLLTGAGTAPAASFDCRKASTPDERAVCADPVVSGLDSEMGALWFAYSRMPLLMGASGARRDDAHAFLAARAKCARDTACLAALYTARNATLKHQLGGAIETLTREANADPTALPAPQPILDQAAALVAQCRQLGGTIEDGALPEMMSADLDGDGKPDYVLNAQNLLCDGAATAYCANDGCDIWIGLSSAAYAPIKLRGSRPTLVQGTTSTTLDIWVDKSRCGSPPPSKACWGTWSWNGAALTPRYSARAD